jgi:hypothetical protein
MMSWDALGTVAAALMAFMALNAGTVKWLLERHEGAIEQQLASLKREGSDFSHEIERQVLKLKAQLPLEYVRRQDWIRFLEHAGRQARRDAYRAAGRDHRAEGTYRRAHRRDLGKARKCGAMDQNDVRAKR